MASASGLVCLALKPWGGDGIARLVVCPPRKRTWRWIWSVLFSVTSSIRSRAIRLRSRCGVAGSDHREGKSVASWRTRCLCSSVSWAFAAAVARSYSSWAVWWARSASFQSASSVSATSRLSGSTER